MTLLLLLMWLLQSEMYLQRLDWVQIGLPCSHSPFRLRALVLSHLSVEQDDATRLKGKNQTIRYHCSEMRSSHFQSLRPVVAKYKGDLVRDYEEVSEGCQLDMNEWTNFSQRVYTPMTNEYV